VGYICVLKIHLDLLHLFLFFFVVKYCEFECMKERILKLIEDEKITAAEFADRIGVQRSNVSHILNGRNNPGYTFIQKIIETFPLINSRWLLTGEGNMYEGKGSPSENSIKTKDLLNSQQLDNKVVTESISNENIPLNLTEIQVQTRKPEKVKEKELVAKKVVKVLFFYDDHTFEDFLPAEKI
jgi:transcriptional regulator with XRE-family HTH domain